MRDLESHLVRHLELQASSRAPLLWMPRVYSDSSPLLAAQVLASLSELLDAQSVHTQPCQLLRIPRKA